MWVLLSMVGLAKCSAAAPAAPAVVAGLDDVAVVCEPIAQRGRHLDVAEHVGPFGEIEVGRDDDGGALVKPADQVEEQLPPVCAKGR